MNDSIEALGEKGEVGAAGHQERAAFAQPGPAVKPAVRLSSRRSLPGWGDAIEFYKRLN